MNVVTTPCPKCGGIGTLTMTTVMVAKDPTTMALAGVQLKTGASEAPKLTCSCGWTLVGEFEVSNAGKSYAVFNPTTTGDAA